jgi:hypothetical protein
MRRRTASRPTGESLESRALLTSGAGNTFAMVTGTVTEANKAATETFRIDPSEFTAPKRSVTLGIDVAAASGSSLSPLVTSVQDGTGKREIAQIRSIYGSAVGDDAAGTLASALLVNLNLKTAKGGAFQGTSFQVEVEGQDNTTGGFLLGYYLPGDVDGDGSVTKADIKSIKAAKNAELGDTNYNFNADTNRDGRINGSDVNLAQKNLGVRTVVQPVVKANLDPASDSGVANRETVYQNAIFNGTGTPGASVSYTETESKTPAVSTTIAADGTYSLTIPLAEGDNTFLVSAKDKFGQEISGTIDKVTYAKPLVPVESPTTPSDPPEPVVTVQAATTKTDQAASLRAKLAAKRSAS